MSNRTRDQLSQEFFRLQNVHQVANWTIMLTESEKESINDVVKVYLDTMTKEIYNER